MRLRNNPKLRWNAEPLWDPASWKWVYSVGVPTVPGSIADGKLASARAFSDSEGIPAIELTVSFNRTMCSTILRLDDAASTTRFAQQLNELRGFTLKQIGEMDIS